MNDILELFDHTLSTYQYNDIAGLLKYLTTICDVLTNLPNGVQISNDEIDGSTCILEHSMGNTQKNYFTWRTPLKRNKI